VDVYVSSRVLSCLSRGHGGLTIPNNMAVHFPSHAEVSASFACCKYAGTCEILYLPIRELLA
jgi:hypothetical protein